MSVKGKVVFITGASSGIGAALAREFHNQGAHLVLVARRIERLEALRAELRDDSIKTLVYPCDVTREEDLLRVVDFARAELGSLDIVVANAGFGVNGFIEKLKLEDFHRQFETNVYGVIRTLYATLTDLKRSRGRFVVIGSGMGYFSLPGTAPYSMSKFAVRAFCDSLREELYPQGIAVTHIWPGFIATEFRHVSNQGKWQEFSRDPVPQWIQCSPTKAARIIVKAIEKKKAHQAITFHARFAVFISRFFPSLLFSVVRFLDRKSVV